MFNAAIAFSSVSDAASPPPVLAAVAAAEAALDAGSSCLVEAEAEACVCMSSNWGGEEIWPCGDEDAFMASTRGAVGGEAVDT